MFRGQKFGFPALKPKPPVGYWIDKTLLRQVPVGHILGIFRMALLLSPCCRRRIRVRLNYEKGRWTYVPNQCCSHCPRVWQLNLKISDSGFVLKARLKLMKYGHKK